VLVFGTAIGVELKVRSAAGLKVVYLNFIQPVFCSINTNEKADISTELFEK